MPVGNSLKSSGMYLFKTKNFQYKSQVLSSLKAMTIVLSALVNFEINLLNVASGFV